MSFSALSPESEKVSPMRNWGWMERKGFLGSWHVWLHGTCYVTPIYQKFAEISLPFGLKKRLNNLHCNDFMLMELQVCYVPNIRCNTSRFCTYETFWPRSSPNLFHVNGASKHSNFFESADWHATHRNETVSSPMAVCDCSKSAESTCLERMEKPDR